MTSRIKWVGASLFCGGLLALAGCGGSDDDGGAPVAPASTTTNVSATVIDGPLQNALVCMDVNGNGQCDAGEVSAMTDANGVVTLAVPNADLGKHALLAVVDTKSLDSGVAVPTPYVLSTPADRTDVISPLTSLVVQTMSTSGATSTDAAKAVQDATGITASLFQDYTKATAPTDGSTPPATLARLLVLASQQQSGQIGAVSALTSIDGSIITQSDVEKAIWKKLAELLPSLVQAVSDPSVAGATGAALDAALLAAADTSLTTSGLTAASVPTVVAINNQVATNAPATTGTPGGATLAALTFTDASNYFFRVFTATAAQDTPDAKGDVRFIERRLSDNSGNLAEWGSGSGPQRGSDLHWNGNAWVTCAPNHESVTHARTAGGASPYDYCDAFETGSSTRAIFDVAGKAMTDVYAQIRAAGLTNIFIGDTQALGAATFPANSKLYYQTNTTLTEAVAYYPAGANSPAGTSNVVTQYSAAVAAGGDGTTAAGAACNSSETLGSGVDATTLAGLVTNRTGVPCSFGQGTFTYGGTTYASGAKNEWWGQSTLSIGKVGSAPVNTGVAPGYYTTNTPIRVAFTGSGANAVTYYACKERFNNGSVRNCTAIGTGTYAITPLGDAKVMTLTNPPPQAATLGYNRVFVERGGLVYFGYQNKLGTTTTARLNTDGGSALLTQLGLPVQDPAVPLALTSGSYQGTWDVNQAGTTTGGTALFLNANGTTSCQDRSDNTFFACTVTITDPATGAFDYSDDGSTATGTFDFLNGTVTGNFHDPDSTPVDGTFVGGRR